MYIAYLLTGEEMASCDARTSEVIGIPSLVLMERAALSVADSVDAFLRPKFPGDRRGRVPVILAAAGRGNNGADALAAGRILLDRGYDVRFCRLSGKVSPDSSFAVQEKILQSYGTSVKEFPESSLYSMYGLQDDHAQAAEKADIPDVIIDGLFGTGLSRNLEGEAAKCVQAINHCRDLYGTYVVAVDIPSGISSDDGRVMGCAVRCDETRTFAFYKRGHFMHPGTVFAGACHLAEIGITWRAFEKAPSMFTLQDVRARNLVPEREQGGNKGTFGKILLVAGRRNMCGAALLAARACMSAGAGMVKIFTHEANRVIIQQSLPEALLDTFTDEDTPSAAAAKLVKSLEWADIAAAGPAMGTDEAAKALLRTILLNVQKEDPVDPAGHIETSAPAKKGARRSVRGLVLDADALRILSADEELCGLLAGRRQEIPCVLTPHLAEFAALARRTVAECLADRTLLVQEQADRLSCTIACKDARTLVVRPQLEKDCFSCGDRDDEGQAGPVVRMYLNTGGNSGMASAGSGDVLTGMTAAFLALDFACKESCSAVWDRTNRSGEKKKLFTEEECSTGFAAAVTAVCLHGAAGDLAAKEYGKQGMTANDLAAELRRADFWA